MKKLLSIAAAIACCGCLAVSASAADKFESAEKAAENITVGWNLGNSLDSCGDWIDQYTAAEPADFEKAWGNPVTTKALITAVKNSGFNTVRVPVTWNQHIDAKGNIDKEWLDRVQEVVDYVISQDMYCVLNVHHDGGSDGWLVASESSYNSTKERFGGLWTNIAERFKDYDEKLIFESYNEMLDASDRWNTTNTEGYKAANDFNQLFVDSVRATGGNNAQRNLMVQTYSASTAVDALENFALPKDSAKEHLMVQVHNYDPQGFTWKDATWTTMTDEWGSEQEEFIIYLCDVVGDYSDKLDVPFIIGEFGAVDKDNDEARAEYAEFFISEAGKHGIKCFWWDNGAAEDFSLFDRTAYTVLYPEVVKALTGVTAPSVLKGDADGSGAVNALDAAYILTSLVNGSALTSAADFSGDGNINALDAAAILRSLVGA